MNFVKIKPSKFIMGSPKTEAGRWDDEVQREVEIKDEFEIMDCPVTNDDWYQNCTLERPKFGTFPKIDVSFDDVAEFIKNLNHQDDGYIYRLPTEEEWEYCCRAGTTTAYSFGDDPNKLEEYAWFWNNSERKAHPVGEKKPNPWGLYDMHGNIWEWTSSLYDPSGSHRVIRGGSWNVGAQDLRSASRYDA